MLLVSVVCLVLLAFIGFNPREVPDPYFYSAATVGITTAIWQAVASPIQRPAAIVIAGFFFLVLLALVAANIALRRERKSKAETGRPLIGAQTVRTDKV